MATPPLSDVIDEYIAYRRIWFAANTVRNTTKTLRLFLAFMGNVKVSSIEPRHMDAYLAKRSTTCSQSSINTELSILRPFFEWCRQRRYLPPTKMPLSGWKNFKVIPPKRLLIPAPEFPRLLNASHGTDADDPAIKGVVGHPRDRIAVAIGLYLFLRGSEIQLLTLDDVDLDRGEVHVVIQKTKDRDVMPICEELDYELRRWLTFYGTEVPIAGHGSYALVPAKTSPELRHSEDRGPYMGTWGNLIPDQAVRHPYRIPKAPLSRLGYETDGEGGHTLRRSGARALYDQLKSEGHDRAARRVQAMLHHASIQMTERYIGIDIDRKERNDLLRGRRMFPTPDVTRLTPREDDSGQEGSAGVQPLRLRG